MMNYKGKEEGTSTAAWKKSLDSGFFLAGSGEEKIMT